MMELREYGVAGAVGRRLRTERLLHAKHSSCSAWRGCLRAHCPANESLAAPMPWGYRSSIPAVALRRCQKGVLWNPLRRQAKQLRPCEGPEAPARRALEHRAGWARMSHL